MTCSSLAVPADPPLGTSWLVRRTVEHIAGTVASSVLPVTIHTVTPGRSPVLHTRVHTCLFGASRPSVSFCSSAACGSWVAREGTRRHRSRAPVSGTAAKSNDQFLPRLWHHRKSEVSHHHTAAKLMLFFIRRLPSPAQIKKDRSRALPPAPPITLCPRRPFRARVPRRPGTQHPTC